MSTETRSKTKPALQGKLLVATPYVQESPYRHSVVLLMQHTDGGACGLVLDNDLQANLSHVQEYLRAGRSGRERLKAEHPGLRLFSGCIIWPAGQLDREVSMGIWMTTSARLNSEVVSHDLWYSLLCQIGRSVLEETLHIREFPSDPGLN